MTKHFLNTRNHVENWRACVYGLTEFTLEPYSSESRDNYTICLLESIVTIINYDKIKVRGTVTEATE